jgi:hypothetical protein
MVPCSSLAIAMMDCITTMEKLVCLDANSGANAFD